MRILADRTLPRPNHYRPLPARIEVSAATDLVAAALERALEGERAERPHEAAVHAELALHLADLRAPCLEQVTALRLLCRLATDRRREEEAAAFGRRAAALALQLQQLELWSAAMLEWAEAHRNFPASAPAADAIHLEMIARGGSWDRAEVSRAGAEALAATALDGDDPERAVEFAWRGLEYLAQEGEHDGADRVADHARRHTVLSGLLGIGLARLGLPGAAERALRPPAAARRAERFFMRAARALALAEAGRPELVLESAAAFVPPAEVLEAAAGEQLAEAELAIRGGVWLARAFRLAHLPAAARGIAAATLELARRHGHRGLVRQARAALDAVVLAKPLAPWLPLTDAASTHVRDIAHLVEHGGAEPGAVSSS